MQLQEQRQLLEDVVSRVSSEGDSQPRPPVQAPTHALPAGSPGHRPAVADRCGGGGGSVKPVVEIARLALPEGPPPQHSARSARSARSSSPRSRSGATIMTPFRMLCAGGDDRSPSRELRRRVLVTGGTGLLGRPLLRELTSRDLAVTVTSTQPHSRLHPALQQLLADTGAEHVQLDVLTSGAKERLVALMRDRGVDLVVNLAADRGGVRPDGEKRSKSNPELNSQFPATLADITAQASAHLIHISSEYVWSGDGNSPKGYPPTRIGKDPRFVQDDRGEPYAVEKRTAEEYLSGSSRCTVVRIPVLYGHMLHALEDGTASACIDDLLGANVLKHDQWQQRYPTSANDVAFILGAMVQKFFRSGLRFQVYNYGAQQSVSKYEFMRRFAEATNLRERLPEISADDAGQWLPAERRPPRDVKLDIEETRAELSQVGDWTEPSCLDVAAIRSVWLPLFADRLALLKADAVASNL